MLEFRNITLKDDLKNIGRLLYYTDPYIYPAFFGNIEYAECIIEAAIKKSIYCFNTQDIFCTFIDDMPVGMICVNPEGKRKWINEDWIRLLVDMRFKKTDCFQCVSEKYFEPMNNEKFENQIYILALSVLPSMRGNTIGKQMLQKFLEKYSEKQVVLDTLENNLSAIALYKKHGFKEIKKYIGFCTEGLGPNCLRMIKG